MKDKLIEILVCPTSKSSLKLVVEKREGDDVIEGLSRVGLERPLPARILLYNGEETLENLNNAIADKNHSYVIISKISSGNVQIKPIPLNPITIRDRFRKSIGLVSYL